MNYRFFLVFCCAQLLNAAEDTAKQLPQRCNAQSLQLSPLPEEAPARFDGQDPEQRQLSPRDTLDLRYPVDALQLPEGRSQSPVNEQPEDGDNAPKKVSMSTIRQSIKNLGEAVGAEHTSYHVFLPDDDRRHRELLVVVQPVGGPLGFAYVSPEREQDQDDSNDQDQEDQDCCKEVAAACDRMANIVGYLTGGFGAVVAANYLMQQIQENHAKIE
ncbi:MAG: hypothetical protein LVQ75_02855 [Candidatus Babeliales bacterium]|jgi:hypothetical protein